ncbi:hemolysin family protein [Desulfohalovibrio reitneri]|uniref:hemolysin family protein n=1 Tax=Desulfohalovibrio reitneri TaxID=1307759 RepID=UPI0004A6EC00|nr:hemolysin family protein [Desulfohalovibrio reitneri]
MEDGSPSSSDGGFWSTLANLFKNRNGHSLEDTIRESLREGEIKVDDVAMLLGVLRLQNTQVQDIMVPRPDIIFADEANGVEGVAQLIIESGHSRIPVYSGDKDNIVGIIHAKDLLRALVGDSRPSLGELMRQPLFIPETKNVRDMLQDFRRRRMHQAIALDEYGGTSGLVTLEDVLEEIVGEIEDEHDIGQPLEIQELPDGTFLVAGRLELDELNERFNTNIDSGQVETIGGYLCELTGRVPRQGEFFTLEGHRFTVKEANKKNIRWIHVQSAAQSD